MELTSRTLVAEIAGPSGAGKSTLSHVLNSNGEAVRAGITVWGLPAPSLIAGALLSVPDLLTVSFERRALRSDELKQVIRLTAFRRLLAGNIKRNKGRSLDALFMDEGVVFALAKLRADIGTGFTNKGLERWEKKMLDRWSRILDAVIWLDAPDNILIERIRNREKEHRMKNEPDRRISEFLMRYREAYEFVISELTRRSNIQVLRFDTENCDSAKLAEEILRFTGAPASPGRNGRVLNAARGIENEQTV